MMSVDSSVTAAYSAIAVTAVLFLAIVVAADAALAVAALIGVFVGPAALEVPIAPVAPFVPDILADMGKHIRCC